VLFKQKHFPPFCCCRCVGAWLLLQVLRSGACPGNKSLAELQADYRAARALVLDQLRRQQEDAEQQRKRILMQIGHAINSSKWRA
jgi:hypothetical protein